MMATSKACRPTRARARARRHAPADLLREVFARTRAPGFERYLKTLLVELCRIDTTPKPEPKQMAAAEAACFRIVERELQGLGFEGARLERRPINPAIQKHPNYSLLHFTKTPERPAGLSPEATYAGRANLVCVIPGTNAHAAGQSVALNAHLDVVAPFIAPHVKGSTVFGRGACDDKGPALSIVAALKVLSEVMGQAGLRWNRNVVAMFVVEEETGGNGSLSLALDRELKQQYESILVCECTGLKFHPANRGAVWYRAELKPLPGVSLFELFAFVNEELEREGAAIRTESRHALFPQRPVQTCHGIIGPFGEHPSRICGEASFVVQFASKPNEKLAALVQDCLEAGLAEYLGRYGDKTQVTDPATGQPMVARHYDLRRAGNGFVVEVHGATGHMGAIRERDGAITKMAHLVRSLVYSKERIESVAGTAMRLELGDGPAGRARCPQRAAAKPADATNPSVSELTRRAEDSAPYRPLVLEGGQGFVPTHRMEEVMDRLRRAACRGAENYLRRLGRSERGEQVVSIAYEKLHNAAFDGDANSASVRHAIAAAQACGLWKNEPVLGWTVSCDARLFATEYPGMDVLTFGPGQLAVAHSDREHLAIEELRAAVEFLAVFLLQQTATAGEIRNPKAEIRKKSEGRRRKG